MHPSGACLAAGAMTVASEAELLSQVIERGRTSSSARTTRSPAVAGSSAFDPGCLSSAPLLIP
jgi:hypothetical protein